MMTIRILACFDCNKDTFQVCLYVHNVFFVRKLTDIFSLGAYITGSNAVEYSLADCAVVCSSEVIWSV